MQKQKKVQIREHGCESGTIEKTRFTDDETADSVVPTGYGNQREGAARREKTMETITLRKYVP